MKNKNSKIRMIGLLVSVLMTGVFVLSDLPQNPARAQEGKTSPAPAVPPKFDSQQPKFALLVGITKYKSDTLRPIDGCENNVPLLAETLIKDYGFKKEDVDDTLINEKATKEAIKQRFSSHLIANAAKAKGEGQEAVIVYYFCGHGSQFQDQDGDETDDKKDETFVAYDSRTGDVFDILDDEIDDLKWELRQYTNNTTLIFESCHSGSGSRGEFSDPIYITQETNEDTRIGKPYQRKHPATTEADAATYVEIAASASNKTSLSDSKENCRCENPYSFMTKALVEGLKRATHSTTYRGLIREVSNAVAEMTSNQEPQVEGNRDMILFGGNARRAKPYIEIESILPDKITIMAGRNAGLKEGVSVEIYSSVSRTFSEEAFRLTKGTVSKVEEESSLVQLLPESSVKDINTNSRVVVSGKSEKPKQAFNIKDIIPKKIIIKAGTIHGLKVGSQISIYSSQSETHTGKDFWLANGMISRVGNTASEVDLPTWEETPKIKEIQTSSHVVLASPVFGGGSVLIALNPNNVGTLSADEKSLHQEIEKNLNLQGLLENRIVKLVPNDKLSPAERKESKGIIRLRKGKVKDIFTQPGTNRRYPMEPLADENFCAGNELKTNAPEKIYPPDNAEVYFLDDGVLGGAPLFGKTFDPQEKLDTLALKIALAIRNYTYQNNLRNLENKASELFSMIKVTVRKIPDGALKFKECKDGKKISQRDPTLFNEARFEDIKDGKVPVNSYFQLNIKNVSGEERSKKTEGAGGYGFFVSVIALTTSGEIKNIYPQIGTKNFLGDREELSLLLKTTAPTGAEKYVIVMMNTNGTRDNVDFSYYSTDRGTKRSPLSDFERILTQSGTKTRDAGIMIKDEPDQWGVKNFELNIF